MTRRNGSTNRSAIQYLLPLILLVLVTLLIGCSNQSPTIADREPAEPRLGIVFTSDRTDNWDVFIIQPDGSGVYNLTNHPADDWHPS